MDTEITERNVANHHIKAFASQRCNFKASRVNDGFGVGVQSFANRRTHEVGFDHRDRRGLAQMLGHCTNEVTSTRRRFEHAASFEPHGFSKHPHCMDVVRFCVVSG